MLELPETLHERLQAAIKDKQTSISRFICNVLDKALVAEEEANLDRIYKGFEKLKGIGQSNVTDASTTIDEVLYGENGAWRGSER